MLVKVDQKMRIRLPKRVSEALKLKGKETLDIEVKGEEIRLTKPKKIDLSNDPVLRDMIERPMHSKIKITSRLLEKWKEEMWYP